MSHRLANFYIDSLGKPVEDMFQISSLRFDKETPAIAVVVDVSGSFQSQHPESHLTHLLEALKFTFPPNKVAAYVFGSNWVVVKGFNEQWNAVEKTPSAVTDARGRNRRETLHHPRAHRPLDRPARHKLLVVISDFAFGDPTGSSNVIFKARASGVQVLPIADSGSPDHIQNALSLAAQSLPGRHIVFVVQGLKEVVPSILTYLRNHFRGTAVPGAWWTRTNLEVNLPRLRAYRRARGNVYIGKSRSLGHGGRASVWTCVIGKRNRRGRSTRDEGRTEGQAPARGAGQPMSVPAEGVPCSGRGLRQGQQGSRSGARHLLWAGGSSGRGVPHPERSTHPRPR